MGHNLYHHPLIRNLCSLDLPVMDYVIFGSGPLFARGLVLPNDLDILARGAALRQAREIAMIFGFEERNHISLFDGRIEIYSDWRPGQWDVDAVIDGADFFDGMPFASLQDTLRWKRLMARPKDMLHIRLIKDYLGA